MSGRQGSLRVRPVDDADCQAVDAFLAEHDSTVVARLDALVEPARYPALLAEDDTGLGGVLTYIVDGDSCEVLTLHAANQWHGMGTALIAEVERIAADRGCHRLWLITTNDNVDALRFYQRRGFRLARLHAGAVERSRAAHKPGIPEVGAYGIPIRDELELEKRLRPKP